MPPSEVLVRRAKEEDLGSLGALLRACSANMQLAGIDQWDEIYPTEATLRADVAAGTLHVAAMGDLPIAGALTVDRREESEYASVAWQFAPAAVVHRLMIDPSCQRRGLGRRLMGFAEAEARRLGRRALRLDTFTGNAPSLALYASLGYRDAGVVRFRKGEFRCFEKELA